VSFPAADRHNNIVVHFIIHLNRNFMKRTAMIIALLAAFALPPPKAGAQSFKFDDFRIIKKSLTVGKAGYQAADQSAWLEIGDTSTSRGLLLPRTDTGKITFKSAGLIIYQRKDSSLYFYDGRRWRKPTLQ
jgi:hypothetical protein